MRSPSAKRAPSKESLRSVSERDNPTGLEALDPTLGSPDAGSPSLKPLASGFATQRRPKTNRRPSESATTCRGTIRHRSFRQARAWYQPARDQLDQLRRARYSNGAGAVSASVRRPPAQGEDPHSSFEPHGAPSPPP
jgi:hypothetical protein